MSGRSSATFFVISGLPASGKTTPAMALASSLGLRVLDKDQILEGLFDVLGTGDATWRTVLSRASDDVLFRAARALPGSVLVSFWRRDAVSVTAGTPTAPLMNLPGELVEIFCRCEPDLAARRFVERTRHPGHRDSALSVDEILPRFRQLAETYPVGLGKLVVVDTTEKVDVGATVDALASIDADN